MGGRCRKYYVDWSIMGHPELNFVADEEVVRAWLDYIRRSGLPQPRIECVEE